MVRPASASMPLDSSTNQQVASAPPYNPFHRSASHGSPGANRMSQRPEMIGPSGYDNLNFTTRR